MGLTNHGIFLYETWLRNRHNQIFLSRNISDHFKQPKPIVTLVVTFSGETCVAVMVINESTSMLILKIYLEFIKNVGWHVFHNSNTIREDI